MPFPQEPQNRTALVGASGVPAPLWARWFTELYRTLVPTGDNKVFYIPSTAGAPTFTPEVRAGFVPVVYDATNNDLYVYDSAWVKVTLS